MPPPLICNTNTLGNSDYGIPIVATKSTDYRTTSGTHHRLIPTIPQDFDCRVKEKIKLELLECDVAIREDNKATTHMVAYEPKFYTKSTSDHASKATPLENYNFIRGFQEKVFQNPPSPMRLKISEAKEAYSGKYPEVAHREVYPPEPYAKCDIQALGRDEQPAIPPEEKGYYRWMDPYLTTNRGIHVPFTKDQQEGIARKDILTYYDALGFPKSWGFGPRSGPAVEPLFSKKNVLLQDKMTFKTKVYGRIVRIPVKVVPFFGMQSEYQGNYVPQTFSNMEPYLFQSGEEFEDSLPNASAWQNLPPPGMYCTDYCHIGTGWPVNSIIDYGLPEEFIVH